MIKAIGQVKERRKSWIPDDMDHVLEELPKWGLLAGVLKEVEEERMNSKLESFGGIQASCVNPLRNR